MKKLTIAPLASALLLAVSANGHAAFNPAQYGALDVTFGSAGKQTTSFSPNDDAANDVAVQPNGKYVLAGYARNKTGVQDDFAVLRYNADGNLDTTFGVGGKTTTQFFTSDTYESFEQANAVALQADGKVIAAGWTVNPQGQTVFALARYNVDGTLDSSFNITGLVTTKLRAEAEANDDYIADIALQADGKIVVTGWSWDAAAKAYDVATVRYLSNGMLDPTFGSSKNGIVITPIGPSDDGGNGIVIQPDGKIVVSGASCNSLNCSVTNGNFDFAFVRYNPDGTLDNTFNDDGKGSFTTSILIHNDGASRVTLQQDGKIVASGGRAKGDDNYRQMGDFALVRLLTNGQLDTSFGQMGWVKTPIGLDMSGAADIAYRPDGKLVVAGAAVYNTVNTDFALVMYNPDGSPDVNFGQAGSGIVTTRFGGGMDAANALALQPNGNIIVVGQADSSAYLQDFAAARYLAPDVTPNTFAFPSVSAPDVGVTSTSQTVTISGLDAPTLAMMMTPSGEFSVNGDAFSRTPRMVSNGDQVTVRHTNSMYFNSTPTTSTLNIGGMDGSFTSVTPAAAPQPVSGGGGAAGIETLALFGIPLLAWARRRMRA